MVAGNVRRGSRAPALFLDVDGTLLELAATPGVVRVPAELGELLARLGEQYRGALALVSGRRLLDLERLFAPRRFAAAGLHGLERRDAAGRIVSVALAGSVNGLDYARRRIAAVVAREPRLTLEDKGLALALHFRAAPELAAIAENCLGELADELGPEFHVQQGKFVLELKPASASKGSAITAFMAEPPFRGRRPIFIGDDLTDEDGFAAVNALGGESIRVGPPGESAARARLDGVGDVIAWLNRALGAEAPA
jgi:trehalose 6-phosphate phosphatase